MRTGPYIDDMFTLLTVLDEAESFGALPVYVSNDPDSLPSIRLYENDFGVMMSMLEKFGSKMNLLEAAMCNVAQDVNNIRSKVTSLETSRPTQHTQLQSERRVGSIQRDVNTSRGQSVVVTQAGDLSVPISTTVMTGISSRTSTLVDSPADRNCQLDKQSAQSKDWASLVSSPITG